MSTYVQKGRYASVGTLNRRLFVIIVMGGFYE
ncbi:hypothetical protein SAMN05518849_11279 [Sphingobium sp. AP50]|nr:hypothetical protein SAMN05518849_11279 [Sphingobium sp. AP50]